MSCAGHGPGFAAKTRAEYFLPLSESRVAMTLNHIVGLFREPEGVLPNSIAIGVVFGGYVVAISLMVQHSLALAAVAAVLLASILTVAAYLIHECAHGTVLRKPEHNESLGVLLGWLVGACYAPFAALREKHFIHHAERIDSVSVDYRIFLQRSPLLRKLVLTLENIGIPAVDLVMHSAVIASPFFLPDCRPRRARVMVVLAMRVAFFVWLGWNWPPALLAYAIGYLLFLHVMRFMDAYQHTYPLMVVHNRRDLDARARPPREFEEKHTYSNPAPLLNLITLNFGYHNAHHVKPTAPWYRLPALHAEIYGSMKANTLPFLPLLRNYWRNRIAIVITEDNATEDRVVDANQFPGALGVSFLTQF